MKQVYTLLSNCWLKYMEQTNNGPITFISTIPGNNPAWYIWLEKDYGVYDISLSHWHKLTSHEEESTFLLKHYPYPHHQSFQDLSCGEQIVRISDFFDDSPIQPEHSNNCPCCPTHKGKSTSLQLKGIPKLQAHREIHPSMFLIGEITFFMEANSLKQLSLQAQSISLQYSVSGINIQKDGKPIQILTPGALDRKVQCWYNCWNFLDIFVNTILPKLGYTAIKNDKVTAPGYIFYQQEGGDTWKKEDPSVTLITHTFYF